MLELATNLTKAGWTTAAFGDVVRHVKDKVDPEESGLERYIAGEHMNSDDLRIRRWGEIGDGYLGPAFHMRFKPGHVLYGSRRTYLRKVAVADFEGITANTTYVLETADPEVLLPELLPFIMQTDAFNQHSVRESKGSVNPYVNFSDLAWFEFALPPIEEQRRLAELLRSIDNALEGLRAVKLRSAEMRIPLLRSLLGIREAAEEAAIARGDAKSTPSGHTVVCVKDLSSTDRQGVQVGPFGGSVSSRHFASKGVPVVKINNINEAGELALEDLVFLNESQAKSLADRYSLRTGDLITAAQATIGRTAVVDSRLSGAIISQHIIRIATDPERCNPHWLHALFCSPLVLRQIFGSIQGGTRAGLNTADVEHIRVPLPPLEFQKEVVEQLMTVMGAATDAGDRITRLSEMRRMALARIGENP